MLPWTNLRLRNARIRTPTGLQISAVSIAVILFRLDLSSVSLFCQALLFADELDEAAELCSSLLRDVAAVVRCDPVSHSMPSKILGMAKRDLGDLKEAGP